MSSHHIVREKQEPALLVLGLDNFDDEQLGQLLEWNPTLIATPFIAEKLISLGIKIDWLVTNNNNDDLQSDIKRLAPGKDTVIAAALNYLVTQGYPSVNLVADEFELADYTPFADKINLVVFYQQQKIYAISSGFSKWKPAGESISILTQADDLHTTGLKGAGGNAYTTMADGFFSIKFTAPYIFIAERL